MSFLLLEPNPTQNLRKLVLFPPSPFLVARLLSCPRQMEGALLRVPPRFVPQRRSSFDFGKSIRLLLNDPSIIFKSISLSKSLPREHHQRPPFFFLTTDGPTLLLFKTDVCNREPFHPLSRQERARLSGEPWIGGFISPLQTAMQQSSLVAFLKNMRVWGFLLRPPSPQPNPGSQEALNSPTPPPP